MSSEKLYPARAVRDRFGISDMTIWRWVKKGILPAPIKINERNYFASGAVDALAAGDQPKQAAA